MKNKIPFFRMKKILSVIGCSFLLIGFTLTSFPNKSLASGLSLEFVKNFMNNGSDLSYTSASSMVLDDEGNIYTTGRLYGSSDFDPSENTYSLTSSSITGYSPFVSILSKDGSFIGAYLIGYGENGWSESRFITLDNEGNIYVVGTFGGTVDFDPSENTHTLTSSGISSSFISVLGSDGSFIGVYLIGGVENSGSQASSITFDNEGNMYVVGNFSGTVDFDPSENTHNLISTNNSPYYIDILSSDGSFIGAYKFENGENGWSESHSVALGSDGNIYATGIFGGTVDFDPSENTHNITSVGSSSFISVLGSDGSFIDTYVVVDGKSVGSGATVYSMTFGNEGNIYVAGYFAGTVDFDPSENEYNITSGGGNSSFVSVLGSDGSFIKTYVTGDGEGEYDYSQIFSIALDDQGNIYASGFLSGTADFDPSENTYNLTSGNTNPSSFITILDKDGSFIGAYLIGDGAEENDTSQALSIALDSEKNVYISGYFNGTVDFDPSENTYSMTSPIENNDGSAYVVKFSNQQEQQEETPAPVRSHHTHSSGTTAEAIARFKQTQLQNAINATALAISEQTTANNTATTTGSVHRTLKITMTGDDVKTLQAYLNGHNYPIASAGVGSLGNETTYFGNLTKQAVIKFQLANNLIADGIVGSKTWAKIDSIH